MKAVLVTGGETGIGRAISARLRAAGWSVVTSSHRAESGADIIADLSEPMGPAKLYLAALRLAPELSAIVNNAAVFAGGDAEMEAINLTAPEKLTMLIAGKEDCRSAVVNIIDAEILQEGCGNGAGGTKAAYLKTKRALAEYTRRSAALFAGSLRVNAVAPGPVSAPAGVHEKAAETLLDHRPTAEDVAEAVAFLLDAESVTGVVLPVDCGQHLLGR
jgi:NAD(P)-dependent dehydrogenase (short-subunit alcohol dehydrogenase family)